MVSKITAADGSVVKNIEPRLLKQTISAETSEKIREYCIQVVEGANGTGKRAKPAGYRIGGKTGTAETVSASGTREKDEYVVSFLGYAPAEDPQIAFYVVLNRPNAREQDLETRKACIIAKNILTEVLPYLNIFTIHRKITTISLVPYLFVPRHKLGKFYRIGDNGTHSRNIVYQPVGFCL